jgi:hypothetical protein
MMSETNNSELTWIERAKKRPAIAAALVISVVLAGSVRFKDNVVNLLDFFSQFFTHPYVVSFTLSPDAMGFKETQSPLFAHSEKLYRTFSPTYALENSATALFLVTLANPTKHNIIITDVVYDVKEIGGVKALPSGPLKPLATYAHSIAHAVGEQAKPLKETFAIGAESAGSFEVEIASSTPGDGLGWLLRIGFVSEEERTFYTDEFQLFLFEGIAARSGADSTKPLILKAGANTPPPPREIDHGDLFARRMSGLKLPNNPIIVDCILLLANVKLDLDNYDQTDRQLTYMRAGVNTLDEFLNTEVRPGVMYRNIISNDQAKSLMRLVKTHAYPRSCEGPIPQ